MAAFAFVFGALGLVLLLSAWKPSWLLDNPPDFLLSFHEAIIQLERDHRWAAYAGTGLVSLIAYFALAASFASASSAVSETSISASDRGAYRCVCRTGSIWASWGLAFQTLDSSCRWRIWKAGRSRAAQTARLDVPQRRQHHSLFEDQNHRRQGEEMNLDGFREAAHVIQSKMTTRFQTVPMSFSA